MRIDWDRQASAAAIDAATAVILGTGGPPRAEALKRRGGLESLAAGRPGPADNPAEVTREDIRGTRERAVPRLSGQERIQRVRDAIAAARVADDVQAISAEVIAGARSALAKAASGAPQAEFTLRDQIGLEAVILTNGDRPSLFVDDGFVNLNAADIGDWDWALRRHEADIRSVISSVGRIEVPVNPGFAGTCFVIGEGLAITNRHVLEDIASFDGRRWMLNWPDSTEVDFVGEAGNRATAKFKVQDVVFVGPDAINHRIDFRHLDMAVLRLHTASSNAAFPTAVTVETRAAEPKSKRNIYVLGFPGKPRPWTFDGIPNPGTETAAVLSTLFNNKFGVKKLAPGIVGVGPGCVEGDAKGWILTHDASTLGGNSGSAVVDLTESGLKVVGLHFGGSNRKQNWAHAIARLQDRLATLGGQA